ncbi:hypothetical protein PHISP_07060 [Aspergillus sp. HF37]|nr:hypothetical protein PHISP_07060 [Aspergillus sp. HF37]
MSKNRKIKNRSALATLKNWFTDLRAIRKRIKARPEAALTAKGMQSEGIEVWSLKPESDASSWFFAPQPKRRLISLCRTASHTDWGDFPTWTDRRIYSGDYALGKVFASWILPNHVRRSIDELLLFNTSGSVDVTKNWRLKPYSPNWTIYDASMVCKSKPHMTLSLVTDCKGNDETLTTSELAVITCFLQSSISMQINRKNRQSRRYKPSHMICPILIVSVLNCLQARLIEAYFDGGLKIHYSKLYDFNDTHHKDQMDLFVRWMIPRTRGNTAWISPLPALTESCEEADELCSYGTGTWLF